MERWNPAILMFPCLLLHSGMAQIGACHVILTLRIFLLNYSNYYTSEKSKTPNKIVNNHTSE